MDVEWGVVGFSVGQVGAVRQVEGDVKEIHNFLVGFNCDLKAILVEDLAEVFLDHHNLTRRCVGYSKAVISVQAEVVAIFLLDVVQEKGTDRLTRFSTIVATHCHVKEV